MADKPQTTGEEIIDGIGSALGQFEVFHNQLLIGVWIRPEMTKGGVILPDKTRDEDIYQGTEGIVLKKGPLAFLNDARNDFNGQDVNVGDWVIFKVKDGFSLKVNGVHCRMIEDIHIRARVEHPGIVW